MRRVVRIAGLLMTLALVVGACGSAASPSPSVVPPTPAPGATAAPTAVPSAPIATAPAGKQSLILATTTSTQDSGLLDVLVPAFEQATGYVVKTVAVGSGQAMTMGRECNADVLLVHSPAAEAEFMDAASGVDRRLVMHNDFVLVGPASDPAGIKGTAKAADALTKIAAAEATFVSRADKSGTNAKELALWKQANLTPAGAWYLESGQGMGATLQIASEKGGYTITDRATYLATKDTLALDILVEGDAGLLNVYHVISVNPAACPAVNAVGATAFADYLTSADGQALIGCVRDREVRPAAVRARRRQERGFARNVDCEAMDTPASGAAQALQSLLGGDLVEVTLLSLGVSGLATAISLLVGLPLGTWLALAKFRSRGLTLSFVNTGMALPPVVVGLFVASLLWRSGPLGGLDLIYTPTAMVVAEVIIAAPIVVGLTAASLGQLDPRLRLQLLGLGASRLQMIWWLWKEARLPLLAALMAAFGSVISEVGAAMMVGGNIRHQTRVLTTSIVLETGKGEFAAAIGLGIVLLVLAFLVNAVLTWAQQRGPQR